MLFLFLDQVIYIYKDMKNLKTQLLTNKAFQGELFIIGSAPLWSLFPIFSILAIASIAPLYTAALSTLSAAIAFAIFLTIKKEWHQVLDKSAWKDILLVTLIIGVVFYSLIFIGLQRTTAGNASIISLMEIFFTIVILRAWKKEQLTKKKVFGSIFMVVGAMLILFQGNIQLNEGDLIILVATAIPPAGNYFAQQARKKVGSNTILFLRSLLAGLFVLALAIIFEPTPTQAALTESMPFIIINGVLLLGLSKIFWLEGIHRIPISKAISLSAVTPGLTLFFAYFILNEIPTIWQILGYIPMAFGIFILTEYKFKRGSSRRPSS